MRKLKVGDSVTYKTWTGESKTAKVLSLEICKDGCKYGRPVKQCDIDKHHGTIDLDGNSWCYFDQVTQIHHNNGK